MTQRDLRQELKSEYTAQYGALATEVAPDETWSKGEELMELLGTGFDMASNFLTSPTGIAGLSLVSGFFKVKSRKEGAKTKAETYRKKGEKALEKAKREAQDIREENIFKEAEQVQSVKSTGLFSGQESLREGDLFESVLAANRKAAMELANDVLKEGFGLKEEYDEAAEATKKSAKYGVFGDIAKTVAGAAGAFVDKEKK